MSDKLMARAQVTAGLLRSRAEDLYQEGIWSDGDFMNTVADLLDDITQQDRPSRTSGVWPLPSLLRRLLQGLGR
jgi:hypothetical protein